MCRWIESNRIDIDITDVSLRNSEAYLIQTQHSIHTYIRHAEEKKREKKNRVFRTCTCTCLFDKKNEERRRIMKSSLFLISLNLFESRETHTCSDKEAHTHTHLPSPSQPSLYITRSHSHTRVRGEWKLWFIHFISFQLILLSLSLPPSLSICMYVKPRPAHFTSKKGERGKGDKI